MEGHHHDRSGPGIRPGPQYYETYIVAEFSPAGNMAGQYAANVPAPTAGQNDSATLRWTSFDGSTWTPDTLLSGHRTSAAPAVVALSSNDTAYCVHRGGDSDAALWYTSWNTDTKVPTCLSAAGDVPAGQSDSRIRHQPGLEAAATIWPSLRTARRRRPAP
jgi:hypothetical protein